MFINLAFAQINNSDYHNLRFEQNLSTLILRRSQCDHDSFGIIWSDFSLECNFSLKTCFICRFWNGWSDRVKQVILNNCPGPHHVVQFGTTNLDFLAILYSYRSFLIFSRVFLSLLRKWLISSHRIVRKYRWLIMNHLSVLDNENILIWSLFRILR